MIRFRSNPIKRVWPSGHSSAFALKYVRISLQFHTQPWPCLQARSIIDPAVLSCARAPNSGCAGFESWISSLRFTCLPPIPRGQNACLQCCAGLSIGSLSAGLRDTYSSIKEQYSKAQAGPAHCYVFANDCARYLMLNAKDFIGVLFSVTWLVVLNVIYRLPVCNRSRVFGKRYDFRIEANHQSTPG
jgi:hypothetical protein